MSDTVTMILILLAGMVVTLGMVATVLRGPAYALISIALIVAAAIADTSMRTISRESDAYVAAARRVEADHARLATHLRSAREAVAARCR